MSFEEERKEMIETHLKARGINDEKVLKAMDKVKRHEFVPKEIRNRAYSDYPLPIGHDQTISQPYIVALMTELLELTKKDKVLEIGTGSGYQTAILAEIAEQVVTIERVGELSQTAMKVLCAYSNIEIVIGDGKKGYEDKAPYDAIIVTAAAEEIPYTLIEQLKNGGRLVIPVGKLNQKLKKIIKTKKGIKEQNIIDVRFVPLR